MNFLEKFQSICRFKNSHVCVGLDVDVTLIPPFLKHEKDPMYEFSKAIIDTTSEFAAAFKINTAFFEEQGSKGWQSLEKIVAYLPDNVLKIADAKRSDIGNTSKMYAKAFLKTLPFNAITVNPYLGLDALAPFLCETDKGIFILCLTSNQGAHDFQYLQSGNKFIYEIVAEKVVGWNKNNNCGLVVGATHPAEIRKIRDIAPKLPFLIPGIGAQGGDLAMSLKFTFATSEDPAIFNSSRAIIYASAQKDFAEVAGIKAKHLRDEINNILLDTFPLEQE
jgi:orotidine-5'-phosphate decarboxylase